MRKAGRLTCEWQPGRRAVRDADGIVQTGDSQSIADGM